MCEVPVTAAFSLYGCILSSIIVAQGPQFSQGPAEFKAALLLPNTYDMLNKTPTLIWGVGALAVLPEVPQTMKTRQRTLLCA